MFNLDELLNEIDPETVKTALGELVQTLKQSERKQDESATKLEGLQRVVASMEEEQVNFDCRLRNAHAELNDQREQKRQVEEQLNTPNTALTLKVSGNNCS